MKKVLIIAIFCLTCLMVSPAPASKYEACTGNPDSCPETPELFIDGENATGQVKMILEHGQCFIPLRALMDQLGVYVDRDPHSGTIILGKEGSTTSFKVASSRVIVNGVEQQLNVAPLARGGITYIPVELITKIPQCFAIPVEKANAVAVFSKPRVETPAAAASEMAAILKGYFSVDIHQLPKDVDQIRAVYAAYIHPKNLDAFAENLFEAVTIPTGWGVTEYVDSQVVAQTADSAVVYCRVKLLDCGGESYLHQLWGFKKYNGKWMLVW